MDLTSLPMTFQSVIPEKYMDEMGHMNVACYTHIFTQSMGGMLEMFGLSMEFIEREQIGGAALEAHIHYLAEVMEGDQVKIYTRLVNRTEKRIHNVHFMWNESRNQVAALFEGVMACFDLKARKMSAIPEGICSRIDPMLDTHQALLWPVPVCGVMQA
ncbi:MAG TPA: thioesterase [Verrucomicrobia bacterium]|nr:thioesterase [Verrucomicrobiota bacterium]